MLTNCKEKEARIKATSCKMTNPKTRITGKTKEVEEREQAEANARQERLNNATTVIQDELLIEQLLELVENEPTTDAEDDRSNTPTPSDSNTSFSLQECINEFRARRERRVSTQSREHQQPLDGYAAATTTSRIADVEKEGSSADGHSASRQQAAEPEPTEVELIQQNLSNKQHERKCKPCKDGFCYCFTSDSGDGGGGNFARPGGGGDGDDNSCAARVSGHVRPPRRHRKNSETQQKDSHSQTRERQRRSAPASLKTKSPHKQHKSVSPQKSSIAKSATSNTVVSRREPITAISRLETAEKDAPLIHIIQELHDNCVVSEVRVNKHQLEQQQSEQPRSRSLNSTPKKSAHFHMSEITASSRKSISKKFEAMPTSLATGRDDLEKLSERESELSKEWETSEYQTESNLIKKFVQQRKENNKIQNDGAGDYFIDTNTEDRDHKSPRKHKKPGAPGRLLQKRLSAGAISSMKSRNLGPPPPKPPRLHASQSTSDEQRSNSISSLPSTTPSLKEAERIVDNYLRNHGVDVSQFSKTKIEKNDDVSRHDRRRSEQNYKKVQIQLDDNSEYEYDDGIDADVDAVAEHVDKIAAKYDKKQKHLLRKSYPLPASQQKSYEIGKMPPEPSCPSLSDIERTVHSKRDTFYKRNICQGNYKIKTRPDKEVKELHFGWAEPKINEMLKCDIKAKPKQFRSQATQAEPQIQTQSQSYAQIQDENKRQSQTFGWHMATPISTLAATDQQFPHKIEIDTVDGAGNAAANVDVDGGVDHNLDSNIKTKSTPIKETTTDLLPTPNGKKCKCNNKKFIWGEQWLQYTPRKLHKSKSLSGKSSRTKTFGFRSTSRAFLQSSKKRILRLVSPKKDNKASCDVGVQTSPMHSSIGANSMLQSPPGSYRSALQSSSQQSNTPPTIATTRTTTTTQSQNPTTASDNNTDQQLPREFDFSRTVQSPPKKAPRQRKEPRKLNFPCLATDNGVGCVDLCSGRDECGVSQNFKLTQSYRSYNADLDQDLRLSKMSYVLGSIRARLEASDDYAERTFQAIRRKEQLSASIDCTDGGDIHQHRRKNVSQREGRILHSSFNLENEPIYSEIEEDSIHISGSPNFDNKTGLHASPGVLDITALYAKVNKNQKINRAANELLTKSTPSSPAKPQALGSILHDSLKSRRILNYTTPLPPLAEPETMTSSDETYPDAPPTPPKQKQQQHQQFLETVIESEVYYSSPAQSVSSRAEYTDDYQEAILEDAQSSSQICDPSHYQSLNNIRVQEQHSPPKRNRNLSKSDLSLYRSEIFLDNLCRSEIVMEGESFERLEKQNNNQLTQSQTSMYTNNEATGVESQFSDSVLYETPQFLDVTQEDDIIAGSHHDGDHHIDPPCKQSTPKKNKSSTNDESQTFITKDSQELSIDLFSTASEINHNHSHSCPTTPQQPLTGTPFLELPQKPHACSLNEMNLIDCSQNTSIMERYKRIKNSVRSSLRRSKNFIKKETLKLSNSLNLPTSIHSNISFSSIGSDSQACKSGSDDIQVNSGGSTFYLDPQILLDDRLSVSQQIAKAVTICRQYPDLEVSHEMVEAERLLLFSTIKKSAREQQLIQRKQRTNRIFIDELRLPVKPNPSQDIFFNYFYIVTFMCNGVIRSTHSVECSNQEVVFRDCGIEFFCDSIDSRGKETENVDQLNEIRCEIFMLRLRKVSTLALEPRKSMKTSNNSNNISSNASSSSSCNNDELVSRFRLNALFTINAINFIPYEYVPNETSRIEKVCLRASSSFCLPLTPHKKFTNLGDEIQITGRADLRFSKHVFSGFLNVQDPHTLHNWNRRWCTLDSFHLYIWDEVNDVKEQALLCLDLRQTKQSLPLCEVSGVLCPRARSFCLQCVIRKAGEMEIIDSAAVFFSTDTQTDLSAWLENLNASLEFTAKWMQ